MLKPPHLWEKILVNCPFGYAGDSHGQMRIIICRGSIFSIIILSVEVQEKDLALQTERHLNDTGLW